MEKNKFNRDSALKKLYEESVQFKNSLSHLRTKLKGLNQQFGNYEQRCELMVTEQRTVLKDLGEKIEEERERLEQEKK